MSYIDTLLNAKNNIEATSDVPVNEKLVVIKLIEEKRAIELAMEDPFKYFYSDVSAREDIFEYDTVLDVFYEIASGHASSCIGTFVSFSQLKGNSSLHNWLSSAIKVVDCIAIHYLQEVLGELPQKQGDAGKERSYYIQMNRQGVKAQKAGRIMDNLYVHRNDMEHPIKKDPNNPGKYVLVTPKYNRILRVINKRFPEALINFDDAYKEHYKARA